VNAYHSTEVKHPSFQYATVGQSNKPIIRVDVEMRGNLNPQSINNMMFFDKGTSGMTNAKLYYTTTPTFSTANLIGTLNNSNTAGMFDFNFANPVTVASGFHYF